MQEKGLRNTDVARLADVSEPTSYNWASGKTKSIKGEPLLRAAKIFGVNPEWLASGKGPKYPQADGSLIAQPTVPVTFREKAHAALDRLPESELPEALAFLEYSLEKVKKTNRLKRAGAAIPASQKAA